jgi:hypothetical protein
VCGIGEAAIDGFDDLFSLGFVDVRQHASGRGKKDTVVLDVETARLFVVATHGFAEFEVIDVGAGDGGTLVTRGAWPVLMKSRLVTLSSTLVPRSKEMMSLINETVTMPRINSWRRRDSNLA